jgi:hypothetical protein
MQTMFWGNSGLSAALDLLRTQIQHIVAVMAWALIVGLAAAAGCWCCGYAIRSTWLSAGPLAHRSGRGSQRPGRTRARRLAGAAGPARLTHDDPVAREASRGIREIEEFLAAVSPGPRQSPEPEGRDRTPET